MWTLIGICLVLGALFFISIPNHRIIVEINQHNLDNYAQIRTFNNELTYDLQLGKPYGPKAYKETDDFIYTYGGTGFVYVDRHNANVYIVLPDDATEERKAYLKSYYTVDASKAKMTVPNFIFLREDQLDDEKHRIMEYLKDRDDVFLDGKTYNIDEKNLHKVVKAISAYFI